MRIFAVRAIAVTRAGVLVTHRLIAWPVASFSLTTGRVLGLVLPLLPGVLARRALGFCLRLRLSLRVPIINILAGLPLFVAGGGRGVAAAGTGGSRTDGFEKCLFAPFEPGGNLSQYPISPRSTFDSSFLNALLENILMDPLGDEIWVVQFLKEFRNAHSLIFSSPSHVILRLFNNHVSALKLSTWMKRRTLRKII